MKARERLKKLVGPNRNRLAACLVAALVTGFCLNGLTPPYASQSVVVLQEGYRSLVAPDLGGLGLFGGLEEKSNLRMLRELMLSYETLVEVDRRLDLRGYIRAHGNLFERATMAGDDPDALLALANHLCDIRVDDRAGLLTLTTRAQEPAMAQKLGRVLVDVAQRRINDLAQAAAVEQLHFLDREIKRFAQEQQSAERKLQEFQDRNKLTAAEIGVMSSQSGTPAVAPEQLIAWQQKLSELQVRRGALKQFLRDDSPEVQAIDAEMASVQGQIEQRRDVLLTHPGKLNLGNVRFEFLGLMTDLEMARDLYLGTVKATAAARADASRMLKRLDTVQAPTLPVRPERGLSLLAFAGALFAAYVLWRLLDNFKRYVDVHHD